MSPNQPPSGPFGAKSPTSPIRFVTTSNAFGLANSPSSSSSSSSPQFPPAFSAGTDRSPPRLGNSQSRRLRRPSLLSLAQTVSSDENDGKTRALNNVVNGVQPMTALPSLPTQDSSSSTQPAGDTARVEQFGQHGLPQTGSRSFGRTNSNPFAASAMQPNPRWSATSTSTPFLTNSLIRRTSSAPPMELESLSTHTPPNSTSGPKLEDALEEDLEMDMESPVKAENPRVWLPPHLQTDSARRKGKAKVDENAFDSNPNIHPPPFTGRPLHASLLATLISESSPLEHEMRSEARLQRLLSSHPSALPLTPRAPRTTRGRFPETAGDDDDDDDSFGSGWNSRAWMGRTRGATSSSDSDSDDVQMEEGEVNSAFVAGMDMDRPASQASSNGMFGALVQSGNGTGSGSNSRSDSAGQTHPTPPIGTPGAGTVAGAISSTAAAPHWTASRQGPRMSFSQAGAGMVPSPGTGGGLPSAFGGLFMGNGGNTPLGSPTIERLELAGSPSALSVTSPGMMQYRESTAGSASMRPGKRKAAQDDRFDPYKRPRGSSPSLLSASPGLAMSPSKHTSSMPIPQSPSHAPLYSSSLGTAGQGFINSRSTRSAYGRPVVRSRSRAASPALSIGSTSGVLSTSLGSTTAGGRPSFSLGQAFIPTGQGSGQLLQPGGAPQGLGGLGLLSLSNNQRIREREDEERLREEDEEGEGEGEERRGSGGSDMMRSDLAQDMEED